MKYASTTLEETNQIARELLEKIIPGTAATVVALEGDLGAGKTALTQEIAKILNVIENVNSPTFVIEKIYNIDFKNFKKLIHIDAYRLEKEQELINIGWNEIVGNPENLIVIEWPENVPNLIPENAIRVSLKFVDEKIREIHLHES
ncbi:MAG: tRNA (adenosine(37)-N6)-threonylcarbamoyltransferase complex ATPase subunit type 1 TsaE [Patescibacteria group bacterium]